MERIDDPLKVDHQKPRKVSAKNNPSLESQSATTSDKRVSSSPSETASQVHQSQRHINECTHLSENDLTTTISQGASTDGISPSESRSVACSLVLSEGPSDDLCVDHQDRPQLQQWAYETRDPALTVAERLEKSSWERGDTADLV